MNDVSTPSTLAVQSDATRLLARHVVRTRFEDLNERAVHSFRRTLLDYLTTVMGYDVMLRVSSAIPTPPQRCAAGTTPRSPAH